MKRNIIEITEHGTVIIPSETAWMSEAELVSLFGVIAPTVRAAIKAVYKSGILKCMKRNGISTYRTKSVWMFTALKWLSLSLSALTHTERNGCAIPYLKGCTCEKRKQASSFRWEME